MQHVNILQSLFVDPLLLYIANMACYFNSVIYGD